MILVIYKHRLQQLTDHEVKHSIVDSKLIILEASALGSDIADYNKDLHNYLGSNTFLRGYVGERHVALKVYTDVTTSIDTKLSQHTVQSATFP